MTRLSIVVGLASLLGLSALAAAEDGRAPAPAALNGRAEPVQKGHGGVPPEAHYPLKDWANFSAGSARPAPEISGKFSTSDRPDPRRSRVEILSAKFIPEPPRRIVLIAALCLILLLILWIDLKRHAADPSRRRS